MSQRGRTEQTECIDKRTKLKLEYYVRNISNENFIYNLLTKSCIISNGQQKGNRTEKHECRYNRLQLLEVIQVRAFSPGSKMIFLTLIRSESQQNWNQTETKLISRKITFSAAQKNSPVWPSGKKTTPTESLGIIYYIINSFLKAKSPWIRSTDSHPWAWWCWDVVRISAGSPPPPSGLSWPCWWSVTGTISVYSERGRRPAADSEDVVLHLDCVLHAGSFV